MVVGQHPAIFSNNNAGSRSDCATRRTPKRIEPPITALIIHGFGTEDGDNRRFDLIRNPAEGVLKRGANPSL